MTPLIATPDMIDAVATVVHDMMIPMDKQVRHSFLECPTKEKYRNAARTICVIALDFAKQQQEPL